MPIFLKHITVIYGYKGESRRDRGGCDNCSSGSVVRLGWIRVGGGGFEGTTRTNPQVLSGH